MKAKSLKSRVFGTLTSAALVMSSVLPAGSVDVFADNVSADGLPVISDSFETFKYDGTNTWYTGNALGVAGDFHIFAFDDISTIANNGQGTHINGNVATKTLHANNQDHVPKPNEIIDKRLVNVFTEGLDLQYRATWGPDRSPVFANGNLNDNVYPASYYFARSAMDYSQFPPVIYDELLTNPVNNYNGVYAKNGRDGEKIFRPDSNLKPGYIYHGSDSFLDLDAEKSKYEQMSEKMSHLRQTLTWGEDGSVNLEPTGQQVLNLKASDLENGFTLNVNGINVTETGTNEYTYDNQVLIVNINLEGKSSFTLSGTTNYSVIDGSTVAIKDEEEMCYKGTNIIYNFYNGAAGGTTITEAAPSQFVGHVLAPDATYEPWNRSGTIIANKVNLLNETHMSFFPSNLILNLDGKTAKFSKTDVNGTSELPGAKITVYRKDKVEIGKDKFGDVTVELADGETEETAVVESWTSTSKAKEISVDNFAADTVYVMVEEGAPNGYTYAECIYFTVDADGKVTVVDEEGKPAGDKLDKLQMKDGKLDGIKFSKADITGEKEVVGAQVQILDAETGDVVMQWTSESEAKEIEFVDSDNADYSLKKLAFGKEYIFHESNAPQGYAYAVDVTFVIAKSGKIFIKNGTRFVEVGSDEARQVQIIDDAISDDLKISKKAVGGGDEVPGAKLALYLKSDVVVENGKVKFDDNNKPVLKNGKKAVKEWTSGTTPEEIDAKQLYAGAEYILVETGAPEGYAYTEYMTFKLGKDGKPVAGNGVENGVVTMRDKALGGVDISKKAVGGGDEVPGAELALYLKDDVVFENGKVKFDDNNKPVLKSGKEAVDSWTSGNEAHNVNGNKLTADAEYILVENGAPAGYAYTEYMTFKLDRDGKPVAGDGVENGVVTMRDKVIDDIKFSKTDAATSEEVPGAKVQILDKNGEVVAEWTSGDEAVVFTKNPGGENEKDITTFKAGEEYTYHEEGAPDGYAYTDDMKFKIGKDGSVSVFVDDEWVDARDRKVTLADKAIGDIKFSKT
ncbi:MAG: hypothetical protein J6M17_11390, partial [Ruminococcus sp.]|nr:hypothetical protein [Ruminococcus sp.]